jgi:hypothetical protein
MMAINVIVVLNQRGEKGFLNQKNIWFDAKRKKEVTLFI